ncbi:MAG: FtsH protease activity modulator HflK [Gammaproteobacteria bacterium]|nr:FtsH protease activity modulator HflK [Gammaproteobacteria bacterium]MBT7390185.1 FtsH protease activity modulator HflK [Gammaproteobacteria bacterium]MDP0595451.1 FtsH protease activity modulator HflK [Candidatus Thioglobus sp.]
MSKQQNGATMAWNDNNNQTPPELDEVIKDFKNKFNSTFGGKSSGNSGASKAAKGSFKYIFILAFIVWMATGIYIIDPAERGVVLRFGAFQTSTTQGPHWHIPYPIESVYKVNVEQVRSAEIGFRNAQNSYSGGVSSESLMLTRDENMVDVKLAVQYKIANAQDYLFNVSNPELTLSHVVQSIIRQVVGDNTMDFVLTTGRDQVAQDVKMASQSLINDYGLGIQITAVTMQDAQPPVQLKPAFDDVVKAREDEQRYINEARAYANDIVPKARGASQRLLAEAEAYKSEVVSKSEGEAYRFTQILTEYTKAPGVTKERLYRETLEDVLSNTNKVIVDSNSNSLMYLPIDQLINSNKVSRTGSNTSTYNQTPSGQSGESVLRSRENR